MASSRSVSPLTAARVVAAGRVAYGLTCMAAPRVAFGPAGKDAAGPMVWMGRGFGVRDLVLGAGALAALAGSDPGRASGWVAAGAVADGLDLTNAVVFRRELDTAGLVGILTLAVPATLAGAWAARRLGR